MQTAPGEEAAAPDWRESLRTTRQRGLTLINRVAFWFSIVVLAVTLWRMADADWMNFRRHLGYHLFVLGWLAILTYSVRTIGSREIARFWLMGFFPVALVAYLLTEFTESLLGTDNFQTGVVVPLVEESIKYLPLILLTTLLRPRHRHGTLSDFLVLGFMIGAGFSFLEDALYVRVAASGFDDGLLGSLFPTFLSTGQYTVTHAGWTALAGVGVGLISLHRHRAAAVAAGLGEIGWNGLFLSAEFGPRQRVVSVVTDVELEPTPMYDGPPLCDRCMACVEDCPTDAFRKGGQYVLDAFDQLRADGVHVELTFIGNVDAHSYVVPVTPDVHADLLRRLSETEGVTWIRRASNREVLATLAEAHIGLLPTLDDSLGWSVIEMMAAGLPVVAEDGPAARAAIGGGKLTPPDNPAIFARAITAAAADRPALSRTARAHIDTHHSLDAAAATLKSSLADLLP